MDLGLLNFNQFSKFISIHIQYTPEDIDNISRINAGLNMYLLKTYVTKINVKKLECNFIFFYLKFEKIQVSCF